MDGIVGVNSGFKEDSAFYHRCIPQMIGFAPEKVVNMSKSLNNLPNLLAYEYP